MLSFLGIKVKTSDFQIFLWTRLMDFCEVGNKDLIQNNPKIKHISGLSDFVNHLNKAKYNEDRFLHEQFLALQDTLNFSAPETASFVVKVVNPVTDYNDSPTIQQNLR